MAIQHRGRSRRWAALRLRPWIGALGLLSLILGLFLLGFLLQSLASQPPNAPQTAIGTNTPSPDSGPLSERIANNIRLALAKYDLYGVKGWLLFASLVLLGWFLLYQTKQPWWPELGLALFISIFIIGFFLPPLTTDTRVQVSVPSSKISGGAAPFSPGKFVDLLAFVPNASGTPVPQSLSGLEVLAVYQGDGNSVLLALSPEKAPTLQTALGNDKTTFTYRILAAMPTTTPTPTNAPTGKPTATATAIPVVQVRVPVMPANIHPTPSAPPTGGYFRLVIVEQGVSGGTAVATRVTFDTCVKVVSSSDSGELLELPQDKLVQVARSLVASERTSLFADPTCITPDATGSP